MATGDQIWDQGHQKYSYTNEARKHARIDIHSQRSETLYSSSDDTAVARVENAATAFRQLITRALEHFRKEGEELGQLLTELDALSKDDCIPVASCGALKDAKDGGEMTRECFAHYREQLVSLASQLQDAMSAFASSLGVWLQGTAHQKKLDNSALQFVDAISSSSGKPLVQLDVRRLKADIEDKYLQRPDALSPTERQPVFLQLQKDVAVKNIQRLLGSPDARTDTELGIKRMMNMDAGFGWEEEEEDEPMEVLVQGVRDAIELQECEQKVWREYQELSRQWWEQQRKYEHFALESEQDLLVQCQRRKDEDKAYKRDVEALWQQWWMKQRVFESRVQRRMVVRFHLLRRSLGSGRVPTESSQTCAAGKGSSSYRRCAQPPPESGSPVRQWDSLSGGEFTVAQIGAASGQRRTWSKLCMHGRSHCHFAPGCRHGESCKFCHLCQRPPRLSKARRDGVKAKGLGVQRASRSGCLPPEESADKNGPLAR